MKKVFATVQLVVDSGLLFACAVAVPLAFASGSVRAEMTPAETIAAIGARIVGGAVVCGVDGDRINHVLKRVFDESMERSGGSTSDRSPVLGAAALEAGGREVETGRTSCTQVIPAFDDLERKMKELE